MFICKRCASMFRFKSFQSLQFCYYKQNFAPKFNCYKSFNTFNSRQFSKYLKYPVKKVYSKIQYDEFLKNSNENEESYITSQNQNKTSLKNKDKRHPFEKAFLERFGPPAEKEDLIKNQVFNSARVYKKNIKSQDETELKNGLRYKKITLSDKIFSSKIINAKSSRFRETSKEILLEGWRLINDAIKHGIKINTFFFTNIETLNKTVYEETGADFYKVKSSDMKLWSDLSTPPGVIAIGKLPKPDEITVDKENLIKLTLVCDNIREPGNLGSILRSAIAVGCERILLLKGCVDLWDPKVLRSASGSHFLAPIVKDVEWPLVHSYLTSSTKVFLADNNISFDSEYAEKRNKKHLTNFSSDRLSSTPYYTTDFTELSRIALVVGGETEGLSNEAYRLARSFEGEKLRIPMISNMDSLNVNIATSIIMFEIKRQLELAKTENSFRA